MTHKKLHHVHVNMKQCSKLVRSYRQVYFRANLPTYDVARLAYNVCIISMEKLLCFSLTAGHANFTCSDQKLPAQDGFGQLFGTLI